MSTFFEIGADALARGSLVEEYLTQSEGELTSDVESAFDDWLRENNQDLTRKLDGYGALIREWEEKAAARKTEAKRLMELAQVDENKVRWAKVRLKIFFELTARSKEETARFKFAIVKNGGKTPLVLDDGVDWEQAHEEYPAFVMPRYEPLKEELRVALGDGEEFPFARLGERGTNLRIR